MIGNTFQDQVLRRSREPKAGWTCQMIDKIPNWIPPPWIDPDQKPRRNTAHHAEITFNPDPDRVQPAFQPSRT